MAMIEETPKIGGILKATKEKLAIGKDRIYTPRDNGITLHTARIRLPVCMLALLGQGTLLSLQA